MERLEDLIVPAPLVVKLSTDTGSESELRTILGQARSGDTISFDANLNGDTITLTQNKQIQVPAGVALDAGNVNITISGNNATRIFEVAAGNLVTINNLKFTQGKVTDANGGALLVDGGANLTLNNDTFTNNSAAKNTGSASGGAIEDDGTLTAYGCTFSTNSADFGGGAINASGDSADLVKLTVFGATFQSNTATSIIGAGGAISTRAAINNVQTSTFSGNTAGLTGGAIDYTIINTGTPAVAYNSVFNLNEDTFTAQNSALQGGAVNVDVNVNAGTISTSITNTTFDHNQTTGTLIVGPGGGAVFLSQTTSGTGSASATLINDTFFMNSSVKNGGGLYLSASNTGTGTNSAALTSLTVNQNTAANAGGGVYIDAAAPPLGQPRPVSVDNSIFDGNTVTNPSAGDPLDFYTSRG